MKTKLALALCTASFFVAYPLLAQSSTGLEHGRGHGHGHGNNSNHSGHDDDGNSAGHRQDRPHGFGDNDNLVLAGRFNVTSVAAAVTSTTGDLRAGNLSTPAGTLVPAAAQASTYTLLASDVRPAASVDAISAALSQAGPAASALVPKLVESFADLRTNPSRLPGVVAQYNRFTNAASNEFVSNPPAEFLAMHSVLARLVSAAGTTK